MIYVCNEPTSLKPRSLTLSLTNATMPVHIHTTISYIEGVMVTELRLEAWYWAWSNEQTKFIGQSVVLVRNTAAAFKSNHKYSRNTTNDIKTHN